MGFVIGVDVGSQSVKGVLCSPEGGAIATASYPCAMSHLANGRSEQDPAEWRLGIAAVTRAVLHQGAIDPRDVSHLGVACQVDGVVPIDRFMRPTRSAIIWLDRRATCQADQLVDKLGVETIARISGLNPDASHIGPKLMWLRDEDAEIYRQAHLLPPVSGYVAGWLTGVVLQDHANASSTLLYDVCAREWSQTLLDAADIDPRLLAPIAPAHSPIGHLTAEAASELGLTIDCVAVVGTGDDHAAALGAGAVSSGVIVDVAGTAEPVAVASATPIFDATYLVETHAHAVDGSFLIENPGFVAGGSTKWLADLLRVEQKAVFDWAALAPPASDGVTFLPALSGATTPRWNDRMRGVFQGLSMNHDHTHLSRAVLEGCAFALRDITDRLGEMHLGGGEIRVVGGGSRSPLWLQIKADVTGLAVRPTLDPEPAALGAAMLAGIASGIFVDAEDAAQRMPRLASHCHEPDPENSARYDDAYRNYQRLFRALEELTT